MPGERMAARLVCPGSGRPPTGTPTRGWAYCPFCYQRVELDFVGTILSAESPKTSELRFAEHRIPGQIPVGDGGWEAPVRLSRQGPDGDWLLRGGRGAHSGADGQLLIGVKLSDAEMRKVVADYQAITKPPPVRPARPADLPDEYHVEIVGPRLGWWRYKITGRGLMEYSEADHSGLPRRSRAAALRFAQARVDRLARRRSQGPEKRDMLPRCVP